MNNSVSAFLARHNFVNHVDVLSVAQAIRDDMIKGLSEAFKKAVIGDRKLSKEPPYVVGYGGFRPGVVAGNCYGKNFKTVSLNTINERKKKEWNMK